MGNGTKALKSGVWYTFSNFLMKSIGILTIPIFTRFLTKSEFGLYNNYTSWQGILTILVTLNLTSTLSRAKYDFGEKFDEYILSVLALSSLSAIIWLAVVSIFHDFFTDFFGVDYKYLNIMMVYLFFLPAIDLFQARERFAFEYRKTVVSSLLLVISTSLLSLVLVIGMENRLTGRILGAALPTIFIGATFYLFFLKKGKRIVVSYWKYALVVCLPYIPHLLSLTLLNSMDRVMIRKWCGAEDTAMYSLAYSCGAVVSMLVTSINSAYGPWLAEKLAGKHYSVIRKYSKYYMLGFSICAVPIMLAAPEILLILGGKGYLAAKYAMPPVALGCICQFFYTMFVNVEQFERKTVGMAVASASAALLNYVLNCFAIPKWGYVAASYTTLIGFLWLLIVHMFLVWRIRLHQVYSYRFAVMLVGMLGVATVGINCLYRNDKIRWLFSAGYILFFAGMAYWKKKRIKEMIAMIRKTE